MADTNNSVNVQDLDQLKQRAQQIIDETAPSANSKERVGGLIKDVIGNTDRLFVHKEDGKGLFSGSYEHLRDKPTFTQNVETAQSEGAYKIGTINLNGTPQIIYGKDTGEGEHGMQRTYFLNIPHDIIPVIPNPNSYQSTTDCFVDTVHNVTWTSDNPNPNEGEDTWQIWAWIIGGTAQTVDGPVRIYNSETSTSNGEDSEEIEWVYLRSTSIYAPEALNSVQASLANAKGTNGTGGIDYTQKKAVPPNWEDHPLGINQENKYEYKAYRVSKNNADGKRTWGETGFIGPILSSAYGEKGEDGDGVEYIFYASKNDSITGANNRPDEWGENDSGKNGKSFQDNEFIKEGSDWMDNPIDLSASGYGQGSVEWVSKREKRNGSWQAYSAPAVWSRLGKDGVVDGYTVDLSNDTMPVGTDFEGNASNYFNTTTIQVYHNGTKVPYRSGGGEGYFDYTVTSTVRSDSQSDYRNIKTTKVDDILQVSIIGEGLADFDQKNAYIGITVSLPNNTTRFVEVTLFGVAVGEAGKSIDLYTSASVIKTNYAESIVVPGTIQLGMKIGEDILYSGTSTGSAEEAGYSFAVYYDGNANQAVSKVGNFAVEAGHNSMTVVAYKGEGATKFTIDSETLPYVKDGKDGVDGSPGQSGQSSFTSTVFVRMSDSEPIAPTSSMGSFSSPHPTMSEPWPAQDGTDNPKLWSDGIPEGNEILWATYRIFTSDGQSPQMSAWATPYKMVDTDWFDVEFSPNEDCPADPCNVTVDSLGTKQGTDGQGSRANGSGERADWYDPTKDKDNTHVQWTDMKWKAERMRTTDVTGRDVWSAWVKTKIVGESGRRGDFKSTVFRRCITKPNRPAGGTYDAPWPGGKRKEDYPDDENVLWYDGFPPLTDSYNGKVYMSVCTFKDDDSEPIWSIPEEAADSEGFDIEFALQQENDLPPHIPTDANRHGGSGEQIWFDPVLDAKDKDNNDRDFTPMCWMAYRRTDNGIEGPWVIIRIKGEKGDSTVATIVDSYSIVADCGVLNYSNGVFSPDKIKVTIMVTGNNATYPSTVVPNGLTFQYSQDGSTWYPRNGQGITYNTGSEERWYSGVTASNFLSADTPVLYFRLMKNDQLQCSYSVTYTGVGKDGQNGQDGKDGIDGPGSEWVYIRTENNTPPVLVEDDYPDHVGHSYEDDDYLPKVVGNKNIEDNNSGDTTNHPYECSDDPKGVSKTWPFEWQAKRNKILPEGATERVWQSYYEAMENHQMALCNVWSESPTVKTLSLKPVPTSVNFRTNAVGDLTTSKPLACIVMQHTTTTSGDSYAPVNPLPSGYYLYYRYVGIYEGTVGGININEWQSYSDSLVLTGQELINTSVSGVEFCLSTAATASEAEDGAIDRFTVPITFDGRNGTNGTNGIDGRDGQDGAVGKMFYSMGEWDSSQLYQIDDLRIPMVHLSSSEWNDATGYGNYYYLDENVATSAQGNVDIPGGASGKWKKAEHYGVVISQGLFAEFAKLGMGLFSGDYLFSMNGYVDGREYLGGAKINGFPAYTRFIGDPYNQSGTISRTITGPVISDRAEIKKVKLATGCTLNLTVTGKMTSGTGTIKIYKGTVAAGGNDSITFGTSEETKILSFTASTPGDYTIEYYGSLSDISISFNMDYAISGMFEPNWWVDLKTGKTYMGNVTIKGSGEFSGTVKANNFYKTIALSSRVGGTLVLTSDGKANIWIYVKTTFTCDENGKTYYGGNYYELSSTEFSELYYYGGDDLGNFTVCTGPADDVIVVSDALQYTYPDNSGYYVVLPRAKDFVGKMVTIHHNIVDAAVTVTQCDDSLNAISTTGISLSDNGNYEYSVTYGAHQDSSFEMSFGETVTLYSVGSSSEAYWIKLK